MAFSKTPRVLITDELSRPGVPGPCDYDPNDASEKRIKGFSIREEDMKKERRQSSGRDPWTDSVIFRILIPRNEPFMNPWFRKNKLFDKERYNSHSIETGAIFISDNSKKTIEGTRKGLSDFVLEQVSMHHRIETGNIARDQKFVFKNHSRFCNVICSQMITDLDGIKVMQCYQCLS